MIIDELILHDFAQYRGRVSIALAPPGPDQPIILFGGLNGAGKTSLLDAIQLCLFGQMARSARREGLSYEAYLAGLIHRGSGVESASVELRFRHISNGEEQIYNVKRHWRRTAKGCSDRLEIIRNDRLDPIATEHWAEQVEEFLPSRIAHLFLFDGEQVGSYADPKSSAELIETAVYNLLGLDLVEKLGSDLSVIERRRRIETRPLEDQDRHIELEKAARDAQDRLDACNSDHAARQAALGRLAAQRSALEEKYRKEGGHLYERRAELERLVHSAEAQFRTCERALREAAAGAAPLLLVPPLVQRMAAQVRAEVESNQAASTDALLAKRDKDLVDLISAKAPAKLVSELERFLAGDRSARRASIAAPRIKMGDLGRDRLRELTEDELASTAADLPGLLTDYEEARLALENARNQLAAVPTAEALTALSLERDQLIAREATLQAEQRAQSEQLERLRRDVFRANCEIDRFMSEADGARLAEDDRMRALRHIGRVRDTLDRFRDAVIRRHLTRIEALVFDSFQQLLRKKTLVNSLSIDPETFQLRLTARDGAPLLPDRLSAGERQLLATSVLWGLARSSGRPLPTVIDTPLGRLDSSHRRRLITHYFPLASHQVILLSTDEEIAGGYFDALRPFIGRVYHLHFDEVDGATKVEDGYFGELAHVG